MPAPHAPPDSQELRRRSRVLEREVAELKTAIADAAARNNVLDDEILMLKELLGEVVDAFDRDQLVSGEVMQTIREATEQ